ncbi:MAG: sugar phosphate nucleotidyltransferase [Thermomicrobiales bacterium]
MDVILPVAGLGSRLRPQTWSKPKPLVSVAGKPMLAHVLDRVLPLEPEKIVFITGYLGDQIETWARSYYPDQHLEFVIQPEMLGQTDAIIRTRQYCNDDALILFPDALFEADFSGIAEPGLDGIAFTKVVDDPSAYGIAVTDGRFITRLVEKPDIPLSHDAVIGIYYFRAIADLFTAIDEQFRLELRTKGEYFLADAIQLMIDAGKKFAIQPIEIWEDAGSADFLLQTNRYLLSSAPPSPVQRPGSIILPPSFVDKTATIENAVIGPFASIGAGAVVRDAVVRDSVVEDNSIIESAILEHSIVGRSSEIIGRPARMNVADTTKVAL